MPDVICVQGWANNNPYEYTEGSFYTIGVLPKNIVQKRIPSSGINIGIFETVDIAMKVMKTDIEDILSDDRYEYVSIKVHQAKEDDYYFCFSGPSENINRYVIVDNNIKHLTGPDNLGEFCKTVK